MGKITGVLGDSFNSRHISASNIELTKNQKGMTLVEVMIAGAIASVLGLGVATMVTNMNKGVVSVERKSDFVDLEQTLKQFSVTNSGCATVVGAAVNGTGSAVQVNSTTAVNLGTLLVPGNPSVSITPNAACGAASKYGNIYITSASIIPSNQSITTTTWTGTLRITGERYDCSKAAKNRIGAPMMTDIPLILIDSNSDNRADSCTAAASTSVGAQSELIVAQVGPADCIGSTGATIQSCLTRAASGGMYAKSVLIKAGTYTAVGDLTLANGVTVRGEPGVTILQSAAALTRGVFNITNDFNIIRDLTIDMTPNTSGGWRPGVYVNGATADDVTMDNLVFTQTNSGASSGAIQIDAQADTSNITIRNSSFGMVGAIYYGAPITTYGNGTNSIYNLRIENNYVNSNNLAAFTFGAAPSSNLINTFVENNIIDLNVNNTGGMYFYQWQNSYSSRLYIKNNVINAVAATGNGKFGFQFSTDSGGYTGNYDTTEISGNYVNLNDAGSGMFSVAKINKMNIDRNDIRTSGTAFSANGIYLNTAMAISNINITNNFLYGATPGGVETTSGNGIYLYSNGTARRINIEGNTIQSFYNQINISVSTTVGQVRIVNNFLSAYALGATSGDAISINGSGSVYFQFNISDNVFSVIGGIGAVTVSRSAAYIANSMTRLNISNNIVEGYASITRIIGAASLDTVSISNNVIQGSGLNSALYASFTNSNNLSITNNTMEAAATSTYNAIQVTASGSTDAMISGNQITSFQNGINTSSLSSPFTAKIINNYINSPSKLAGSVGINATAQTEISHNFLNNFVTGIATQSIGIITANDILNATIGISAMSAAVISNNYSFCVASTAGTTGIFHGGASATISGNAVGYCEVGINAGNSIFNTITGNKVGTPGNLTWSVGIFGRESMVTGNHLTGHVYGIVMNGAAGGLSGSTVTGNSIANWDWNTSATTGAGILIYGPNPHVVNGNVIDGGGALRYRYGILAADGGSGSPTNVIASNNMIYRINVGAGSTYIGSNGAFASGYLSIQTVPASAFTVGYVDGLRWLTTTNFLGTPVTYWRNGIATGYSAFAPGPNLGNSILSGMRCSVQDTSGGGDINATIWKYNPNAQAFATGSTSGTPSAVWIGAYGGAALATATMTPATQYMVMASWSATDQGFGLHMRGCEIYYIPW